MHPVNIAVLAQYQPSTEVIAGMVPVHHRFTATFITVFYRFAHRHFTGPVLVTATLPVSAGTTTLHCQYHICSAQCWASTSPVKNLLLAWHWPRTIQPVPSHMPSMPSLAIHHTTSVSFFSTRRHLLCKLTF